MNLSNKEILEMILSANEEFSRNAQRMEQLASQIEQSNQRYLNDLKRTEIKVDRSGVDQSIDTFRNVVENANKTIDRTQKGFSSVLFCAGFCLISLVALFLIYKKGIETKIDIKEEYRKELSEKGQYNTLKDAEFYSKFWQWVDKNPNDSQNLFRKIEKIEKK